MSGETIDVWGIVKTLEAAGTAIPNGSVVQADDATYDRMGADGNGFPDAQFILTCTFTVAPNANSVISLYARERAVDGALDTDAPTASYPGRVIGSFAVNANSPSSSRTMAFMAYDLPAKADYYIHNNGTGQSISAGWTLKVKPRSYKAA